MIQKKTLYCLRFTLKTLTMRYLSIYRAYLSVQDFAIPHLANVPNERKQT